MLVDRALMFVHMGMEVEDQWGKAVEALRNMSNLEIALTWRRLSSRAPVGDFRVHSEYKCLFKRALREAEGSVANPVHNVGLVADMDEGGAWDGISNLGIGSEHFEFNRFSRENSGFSTKSSTGYFPVYSNDDKDEYTRRLMLVIKEFGIRDDLKVELLHTLKNATIL